MDHVEIKAARKALGLRQTDGFDIDGVV